MHIKKARGDPSFSCNVILVKKLLGRTCRHRFRGLCCCLSVGRLLCWGKRLVDSLYLFRGMLKSAGERRICCKFFTHDFLRAMHGFQSSGALSEIGTIFTPLWVRSAQTSSILCYRRRVLLLLPCIFGADDLMCCFSISRLICSGNAYALACIAYSDTLAARFE